MRRLKQFFKRFSWYKELRYIYRSLVIYRKPFAYIYYRFIIGPKIRRLKKPIDRPPTDDSYSIHILCSHNDLTMLLWSLASWYSVVPNSAQVYIHEDGSLTPDDNKIIAKILPYAKLVKNDQSLSNASREWLTSYPNAEKFRKNNVLSIKIIDPYFVSPKDKLLILDTDLLWFNIPYELLDHNTIKRSFMMTGRLPMDFYFADGRNLPTDINTANSGVVFYNRSNFSMTNLENFLVKVSSNTNEHFVEQAGFAYVLSQDNHLDFLDPKKYHIKGGVNDRTILKHYTGPRREQFWLEGVRILKNKLLQ